MALHQPSGRWQLGLLLSLVVVLSWARGLRSAEALLVQIAERWVKARSGGRAGATAAADHGLLPLDLWFGTDPDIDEKSVSSEAPDPRRRRRSLDFQRIQERTTRTRCP